MNSIGKSIQTNVGEALGYVGERLEEMKFAGGLTIEEYEKIEDIEKKINVQYERFEKL